MIVYFFVLISFSIGSRAQYDDTDGVTLTIPERVIHAQTGEDLNLDCIVSVQHLAFYIRNRVDWTFKSDEGPLLKLTNSFYLAPEIYQEFDDGKYRINYDMMPNSGGWRFRLVNSGVGPQDEGTYTCSLLGRRGDIIAHSSVRVIVDN